MVYKKAPKGERKRLRREGSKTKFFHFEFEGRQVVKFQTGNGNALMDFMPTLLCAILIFDCAILHVFESKLICC